MERYTNVKEKDIKETITELTYKNGGYLSVYEDEDEIKFLQSKGHLWHVVGTSKRGQKMYTFPLYPVQVTEVEYKDANGNMVREIKREIVDRSHVVEDHRSYQLLKKSKKQ